MNKKDFFLAAMKAGEYRRKAWVISAFALIQEGPDDWKKEPYAYRIVQAPTGFFFVDPSNDNQLTPIEGGQVGMPLFAVKEKVALKSGEVPNLAMDLETTYGRILTNFTILIYPFGNKIPYLNERLNPSGLEDLIIKRLKDNPEKEEDRNDKDIYVDEYLKFCDAMFHLSGFTQICVPAATPKSLTAAPGIRELRAKLLEENKDRLHDPAVIAKIDAELVAFDKAYLKGDPSEGFLISGKSFNIVRKKLFSMHGAEVGLDEGVDVDLIPTSLSEGWDIRKFPAMNNSLRAGSFNRGAQTMLGGESVKWLLRASSNMTVTKDDCGSQLGNLFTVTADNLDWIVGFHIVDWTPGSPISQGKPAIHIPDAETAKKYFGKTVMVRSPMFCNLEKTDFCKTCVGDRLAANPTALSAAVADYGSVFLSIYMSAAHAKGLMLQKMNYLTAIT